MVIMCMKSENRGFYRGDEITGFTAEINKYIIYCESIMCVQVT